MLTMLQDMPAPPPAPPSPIPDPVILTHDFGAGGPDPAMMMAFLLAMTIVIGAVLWPLVRAFARRIERAGSAGSPEMARELEELRARVGELEQTRARVHELEERVDFAERLLVQRPDAQGLPAGETRL